MNGYLKAAWFLLNWFAGLDKKPANDLHHHARIYPLSPYPAPRTGMRHALSSEKEELTQVLGAQLGAMGHATTAILSCQFREDSDPEQAR
ncbi:MAG: hypothetical protein NVS4B1_23090 [Ktedonobacteraceae bacterium]